MSHQFDIGDRVVVTAEYDGPKVYNRITQGSIGVVEDIEGASMPYYVHFEELDDREWLYGNELATMMRYWGARTTSSLWFTVR